jgi:hypothetical protein
MRLIFALIAAVALAAGLISVLSNDAYGFKVGNNGSRAIFAFRDLDWDAVFGNDISGMISLREMSDKLNAVLGKVSTLEQDLNVSRAALNATRAELNATQIELNAFKAQQAV